VGTELPLDVSEPETLSDPSEGVQDDLTARFGLQAPEQNVFVALDDGWVPLLSEGMLGEAVEADEEGAIDLMQEIASQGFGTVQSTLAAEGTELPSLEFEAVPPGEGPAELEGPFWQVTFSTEHEDAELGGLALLSASGGDEGGDEASTEDQETTAEASSPETSSSAGSSSDADSEVEVSPASFSELGDESIGGDGGADGNLSNFELLAEVDLEVRVELGRRELPLADVLKLTAGSVIELEKMVGEPLSVYANGRLIAEGEAVVIDEQFGVRITNLASEGHRDKAFF